QHLLTMTNDAGGKAAAFKQMADQITSLSGGSWSAVQRLGADGSHIFYGGFGKAVVISPSGQIFGGNITVPGNFAYGPAGMTPIYDALRSIGGP
ncbi:MAG: hypothetical protein ACMG6S_04625, partial [Byssovorax sp.]